MLPALDGEHIYGCSETYVNFFSQNDIKAYRIPAGDQFSGRDSFIKHVGEKTHGFNREDDSPPFYFL